MADALTGELTERRLDDENGEAHAFYRILPVRVGMEATGPILWFERLLAELGHELWIGDSAKIRARRVPLRRILSEGSDSKELSYNPLYLKPLIAHCDLEGGAPLTPTNDPQRTSGVPYPCGFARVGLPSLASSSQCSMFNVQPLTF